MRSHRADKQHAQNSKQATDWEQVNEPRRRAPAELAHAILSANETQLLGSKLLTTVHSDAKVAAAFAVPLQRGFVKHIETRRSWPNLRPAHRRDADSRLTGYLHARLRAAAIFRAAGTASESSIRRDAARPARGRAKICVERGVRGAALASLPRRAGAGLSYALALAAARALVLDAAQK